MDDCATTTSAMRLKYALFPMTTTQRSINWSKFRADFYAERQTYKANNGSAYLNRNSFATVV